MRHGARGGYAYKSSFKSVGGGGGAHLIPQIASSEIIDCSLRTFRFIVFERIDDICVSQLKTGRDITLQIIRQKVANVDIAYHNA